MPRPSSAFKPSHSPDSVACPGLGGVYWRLVKLVFIVLCRFRSGLCVVSCEFNPCGGFSHSPFAPNVLGAGLHVVFGFRNIMLQELLEAASNNIRIVSSRLCVLNGNCDVSLRCASCKRQFREGFAGILYLFCVEGMLKTYKFSTLGRQSDET